VAEAWQQVTHKKYAGQTIVGNISRGVLEITVSNSMLNQRLEFEKKQLLADLKQQLPHTNLKNIRFRTGNVTR
jgi:hypothetical protein